MFVESNHFFSFVDLGLRRGFGTLYFSVSESSSASARS
jgi:hypothetical protein